MRILLDTNILLRLEDLEHAQHPLARSAIDALHANGHLLVIVPQVIYECWVVATRPCDVNGLGLNSTRVEQMVSEWIEVFTLLRDERRVFRFWRELVSRHNVQGKHAHDARLAAAMMRHGVDAILTYNVSDFRGFPGIRCFSPIDVAAGQIP
jgi:predicted nucleic acid-binding protein